MALSNIFRNPKQEITETVIGFIIFAIVVVPDYFFATHVTQTLPDDGPPFFVWMIVGFLGQTAIFFGVWAIHAIGETACDIFDIQWHRRQRR